jgi:hypothetical protein
VGEYADHQQEAKMIEIVDGLFIAPEHVIAVKAAGDGEKRCTIYLSGQSALDGFVVDYDAEDVAEEVAEALEESEDEESGEI